MLGLSARKTQRLQSKSLKGSEIQSKSLSVLGTGTNLEAPFGLELSPPVFTQGHSEDVGFLYSSIHIQNSTCVVLSPGIRRQTAHCVKKGHGIVKTTFCNPETQPRVRQKKCYEKDCPPR